MRADHHRRTLELDIFRVALRKKIADRTLDGGPGGVVPRHAQNQFPQGVPGRAN